jgi:hypothetical protein
VSGAQIVFVEDERGGAWRGRLLRPSACVDTQRRNQPVTWQPFFNIKQGADGRYHAVLQGGPSQVTAGGAAHCGGRRFRSFSTLDEAQQAGIRWAARRFKIKEEP